MAWRRLPRRRRNAFFLALVALVVVVNVNVLLFGYERSGSASSQNNLSGTEASGHSGVDVNNLLKKGIRPNELGMVMILEYHRIAAIEGSFTRSIGNFKRDLETLYAKRYRLIKYSDFLSGHIDTPAGTTPIIFTFCAPGYMKPRLLSGRLPKGVYFAGYEQQ